jgi:hypothetical protein
MCESTHRLKRESVEVLCWKAGGASRSIWKPLGAMSIGSYTQIVRVWLPWQRNTFPASNAISRPRVSSPNLIGYRLAIPNINGSAGRRTHR